MSEELANCEGELDTGLYDVAEMHRQVQRELVELERIEGDVEDRKKVINNQIEEITEYESSLSQLKMRIDQIRAQQKVDAQQAKCAECEG